MSDGGTGKQVAVISEDLCVVCGGCEMVCPTKAIIVKRVGVVDPD